MPKFAKGKYSYAICDRSGWKIRYKDLRREWNGLRVDRRIWEPKHAGLTPVRLINDPQALRDPRPDVFTGATSYVTMNYTASQPGFSTYSPTTQLYEILDMTHGAVAS